MFLKKLLSSFLNIIFILLLVTLILLPRKQKLLIAIILAIFYFFSTTIGANLAIYNLEKPYLNNYYLYYSLITNPKDVIPMFKEINKIVVLTGGIKANGELSEDSLSRLLTALLIYQAIKKYSNKEPEILILGKSIQYNTNIAKYMKLLVTSIQPKYLKDVNIFTENESLDTYQNVKNLKNFVNSNDKIAIVTSAFHITRTKISIKNTFDKNFVQNNIIFVPCNYRYQYKISKYDFLPSIKNLETTNIALSEFVGIVYYKIYYSIKHKKTSN